MCLDSTSAILHFPSSKKSILTYVYKHKSMLQINSGPKVWFLTPRTLLGSATGAWFEKWCSESVKLQSVYISHWFSNENLWKFQWKSTKFSSNLSGGVAKQRRCVLESVKRASKSIKKPCTRHKICKCAKTVIFSKPSMGVVIYYDFLQHFRKIVKFHENPLKWSGDSYYFSDSEKTIIEFTPQNPL